MVCAVRLVEDASSCGSRTCFFALPASFPFDKTLPLRIAERERSICSYLLFVILFLYCLAVCVVLNANNGVHGVNGKIRTAEGLELKILVGGFVLRFGFRWRFPAQYFIEIIAVSFALYQIPLLNHQVYVCVEGCSADARVFLCVLLGQVEVITIGIGSKIEI